MATTEPDGLLVWPPTVVPNRFCYNHSAVTRVHLPDVVEIGIEAFEDSGLAGTLDLPSVRTVGYGSFKGCDALTEVRMPTLQMMKRAAFYGCEQLESVTMPQLKSVPEHGFFGCSNLKTVSMPALETVGSRGFFGCESLTTIDTSQLKQVNDLAFERCAALTGPLTLQVKQLGRGAFEQCVSLTAISLPMVLEVPPSLCIGCTSLREVHAPNALEVCQTAFKGCSQLTTVSLPSATEIADMAFENCFNLARVLLPEVTRMFPSSFMQCTKLRYLSVPKLIDFWTFGMTPLEGCSRDLVIDLGARTELSDLATTFFAYHYDDPGWEVHSQIDMNGALFLVRSKWAGPGVARHKYETTVAVSFIGGDEYNVVVDGRNNLRAAVLASDEIAAGHPDLARAKWGFIETNPTDDEPAVVRDSVTGEELFQLAQQGYSLNMTIWYHEDGGSPPAKRSKRVEAGFADLCI